MSGSSIKNFRKAKIKKQMKAKRELTTTVFFHILVV